MSNLYLRFFHIPKHEKVRESVMLMRAALTVGVILFCLAAMSLSAYAYFSYNVTSRDTHLQAAVFDVDVTVQHTDKDGEQVDVSLDDTRRYVAQLSGNTTYYVTIRVAEKSTTCKGYLMVKTENGDPYYTQQFFKTATSEMVNTDFFVTPTADTKLYFLTCWGTSSHYGSPDAEGDRYIVTGERIRLEVGKGTLTTTTAPQTTTAVTSTTTGSSTVLTTTTSTARATTTTTVTTTTTTTTTAVPTTTFLKTETTTGTVTSDAEITTRVSTSQTAVQSAEQPSAESTTTSTAVTNVSVEKWETTQTVLTTEETEERTTLTATTDTTTSTDAQRETTQAQGSGNEATSSEISAVQTESNTTSPTFD